MRELTYRQAIREARREEMKMFLLLEKILPNLGLLSVMPMVALDTFLLKKPLRKEVMSQKRLSNGTGIPFLSFQMWKKK